MSHMAAPYCRVFLYEMKTREEIQDVHLNSCGKTFYIFSATPGIPPY
jgi:hypothetical protein